MGTLLENKKNEKCRLNLPEGLRELMSDISREVLRAQPSDICGFIADYLSALLVTRDNLAIASQVYSYVCECEGHPELLSELEAIGLDEGNAEIAQDIIIKYFNKEKVNEGSLLSALLARTNIKASMYPAVVNAVRAAYRRHQAHTATKYVTSPEIEEDQVASAVSHTLRLYRDAEPPDGLYGEMATKIQASYRAYGVRRDIASKTLQTTNLRTTMSESHSEQAATSHSSISDGLKKEIELTASMHRKRVNTASSISLAGSICALPTHRPYIAQDIECLSLLEETEKEHARIDYTARSPHVSVISNDGKLVSVKKNKRISFENASEDELYQDETVYEEQIYEATCEEIQDNKEYDDKCSENSEKSISEEIVEIEDLKCEKYDTIEVNKADIEYINVMNMEIDTDSGDDQDLLTTNLDE